MNKPPLVLNFWRRDDRPLVGEDEVIPLLWPVLAWRILAPEASSSRLNLFQRAVLGACRAGRFSPELLAEKLVLHPKLIQAVRSELEARNLIESGTATLTEQGIQLLEGEEMLWEGARSGWMFQDELSGRMLPFFTDRFFQADGEFHEGKGAVVELGGRRLETYVLTSPRFEARPSNEMIARALKSARARNRNRRFMKEGATETVSPESEPSIPPTNLIELLNTRPERVLLLTAGRLSREDYEPTIDDPFGYGEDRSLWVELQDQGKSPTADRTTVEALREIERLADKMRSPELGALHAALLERAREKVRGILSERIEECRAVFDHLVRMEVSLAEAETDDDPMHRFDNARNVARKAIEALLKEAEKRDPEIDDLTAGLIAEAKGDGNNSILESRARALGFSSWPFKLSLKKGDIQSLKARRRSDQVFNLQLSVVALLLRADRSENHRLRQIARVEPDFFKLIHSVKTEGNTGSHDNEAADLIILDELQDRVRAMRSDCYRVVSLLLDLPLNTFFEKDSPHGQKK